MEMLVWKTEFVFDPKTMGHRLEWQCNGCGTALPDGTVYGMSIEEDNNGEYCSLNCVSKEWVRRSMSMDEVDAFWLLEEQSVKKAEEYLLALVEKYPLIISDPP